MDVSKIKFSIEADYDCDEGIDCTKCVSDVTWDKAIEFLEELNFPTYIDGYYHNMTIFFNASDENGEDVKFSDSFVKEYSWIFDDGEYYANGPSESNELPSDMIRLMEDIKRSDEELADNKRKDLEEKIHQLEEELSDLHKQLESLPHS